MDGNISTGNGKILLQYHPIKVSERQINGQVCCKFINFVCLFEPKHWYIQFFITYLLYIHTLQTHTLNTHTHTHIKHTHTHIKHTHTH